MLADNQNRIPVNIRIATALLLPRLLCVVEVSDIFILFVIILAYLSQSQSHTANKLKLSVAYEYRIPNY